MDRDELAAKLDQLEPGESVSVPIYRIMILFEGRFGTLDTDAIKRATVFAGDHGCRLLCYEFTQRDPEFIKARPEPG